MALTQLQPNMLDSGNSFTVTNLTVTGNITTTGTITSTGNVTTTGNFVGTVGSMPSLTITGLTTLQQSTEIVNTKTGATGTVTHDTSTGTVFYHTNIAANFTPNFTNVPTTDGRTIVSVLVLIQGSTPYYPNIMQINGVPQTINWANAITPTPTANRKESVAFTMIRVSGSWTVFGQLASYG